MKQATRKKAPESATVSLTAQRRLAEGGLILFSAIALYLLLALATYHSSDPAWSTTGHSGFIANSGGRVGAFISDVMLYFFGYVAYLFPFMLAFSAWGIFRGEFIIHEFKWTHVLLRFSGFLVTLASACALTAIYLANFHAGIPLSAGGVFGQFVSRELIVAFNPTGSELTLVALFLIGVTFFTGFSWLLFLDYVGKASIICGKAVMFTLSWIKEKFVLLVDAWKDRRAAKAQEVKITVEKPIKQPAKVKEEAPAAVQLHEAPKQKKFDFSKVKPNGDLPSVELLDPPEESHSQGYSEARLKELSEEIEMRLKDFDVECKVMEVHPGPVITRFEVQLAPGTKASKVSVLSRDLARSLSMSSVRVVEVIPGKSYIGLEIPNVGRDTVRLREIIESKKYHDFKSPVTMALGKTISGMPVSVDLAKMPHLLIAGTTGAGKSVSMNVMLVSMLCKSTPRDLRIILIDPKMLELGTYDGIPHLLTPVVTQMKEAANAFRWCVAEMDRRYTLMAAMGVRNIDTYNAKVDSAAKAGSPIKNPYAPEGEEIYMEHLPYIVIAVDEMADMMMTVGKKVEELIARIAQKARAAGIHMILATQRPSVDVITGLIKANIPTRIAFQVSSRIDSRTILDQSGAEQLLGYGDMLYLPPGTGLPVRVHGAYISDDEILRVVNDWKSRGGEPEYLEEVTQGEDEGAVGIDVEGGIDGEADPLYDQAVQIVAETRRASISYVQRRLKIGYNRSANLLEAMEAAGLVSSMGSNGAREVLVPPPPEE